ncbi:hypothetical protein ElyMa_005165300 [Elysia marginata]|uniref:Uncharacterized protein n=1 Tax=Elysia marginata TaxID=1093978 RepID=A0AAV4JW08_9GAST|nr:hypothetical protein ElyMa_005165300 [Elysia marginata]
MGVTAEKMCAGLALLFPGTASDYDVRVGQSGNSWKRTDGVGLSQFMSRPRLIEASANGSRGVRLHQESRQFLSRSRKVDGGL